MMQLIHVAITWLRYQGARLRTLGRDDGLVAQFRCTSPDQVFYILGPGGTVNDLSEEDCRKIEAGTSVALNMGALAPLEFSIYSIENVVSDYQRDCLAEQVRGQSKPAIFWYQDRKKYANDRIEALDREFPMHRYVRASVSIQRDLPTFHRVFRSVMRKRIFETPDLNVTFALTGSVARATLLGCMMGYRKFVFVGVDLGTTKYFWQEDQRLRGVPAWEDKDGFFNPNPNMASFQGGSRVVPTFFEFLRTLHEDSGVALEFATIDPKGRSLLTKFLADELYAGVPAKGA